MLGHRALEGDRRPSRRGRLGEDDEEGVALGRPVQVVQNEGNGVEDQRPGMSAFFLDRVELVPEPGTIALLGLGALALILPQFMGNPLRRDY